MPKKYHPPASKVLQSRMPKHCKKEIRRLIKTYGLKSHEFVVQLRFFAQQRGFFKWFSGRTHAHLENKVAFTLRMPEDVAIEIQLEALDSELGQGEYFYLMFSFCMSRGFSEWLEKAAPRFRGGGLAPEGVAGAITNQDAVQPAAPERQAARDLVAREIPPRGKGSGASRGRKPPAVPHEHKRQKPPPKKTP